MTVTKQDIPLNEAAVAELKMHMRGPVLRPGDAGYDAARSIWNGMIDKRPGLIARCTGVADIIACVNFARTHRLVLAVRSGVTMLPETPSAWGGHGRESRLGGASPSD